MPAPSPQQFEVAIPESQLIDLKQRLALSRLPEQQTVDDWSQGIPLSVLQPVMEYWRDEYDWRRCERRLNSYQHFRHNVDGLDIHFMHVRSKYEDARPLIITHGWPGSFLEFLDVIEPLVDPVAHGRPESEAFHLVIPSLPGYGFSQKPSQAGWSVERIAAAWDTLMIDLGYQHYYAQGGDWGGMVTAMIGSQNRGHCLGIHLNLVVVGPPDKSILTSLTDQEKKSLALFQHYQQQGQGYAAIQSTRPQTIGYALADSPVGQLAWIIEKFGEWSTDDFLSEYSLDSLLDNVSLYWLTNTAASSARLYWHSFAKPCVDAVLIPTACSLFPSEPIQPSKRWAQQRFKDIRYWNEAAKGGHFAAMEQPEIFVQELINGFQQLKD